MSKAPARTELDRALALDIVRVTEGTAVAAALWRGRGNEAAADEAAAAAMYGELARLPVEGSWWWARAKRTRLRCSISAKP